MQSRNKFFDDAARVAGGAAGTLAGMKREFETLARQQMERMLSSLDLVTRDEFDAVCEMAVAARKEQESMARRIAELEATVDKLSASPKKARKKTAAKSRSGATRRK